MQGVRKTYAMKDPVPVSIIVDILLDCGVLAFDPFFLLIVKHSYMDVTQQSHSGCNLVHIINRKMQDLKKKF